MTGTFHDRLRASELDGRAKALSHCKIAIAVEQISKLSEFKLFIEFRVAASDDIEIQMFF
jgi:hypothetical protein